MFHVVERMWVEVNTRINYPVKEALIMMLEHRQIFEFSTPLRAANVGVSHFLTAWYEHPIPGKASYHRVGRLYMQTSSKKH